MNQPIASLRRQAIKRIRSMVSPRMWESGYRDGRIGKSVPLKVWSQCESFKERKVGGYVLESYMGLTLNGVITDVFVGLVVTPFSALPVEDLIKLEKLLAKFFSKEKPL